MRLTSGQPLDDIIRRCRTIRGYCSPISLPIFLDQSHWHESVALNFVLIGESLIDIRRRDVDLYDRFPEAHEIIGLRHRIVHGYRKVDLERLWTFAQVDVPIIEDAAEVLLAEYFDEHGPNPDLSTMVV